MVSDWISRINSAIKYSFYLLFFITPLAMWPDTFELFEFNKMWIVFIITIFIFFLWGTKMVLSGKIEIRRTPLDIPIALFLASQTISTILSIDPHVSLWGYYSRFNGGLLSTIAYIFLYYAFASNLIGRHSVSGNDVRIGNVLRQTSPNNETGFLTDQRQPISYKLLVISLLSGLAVTLWGLPSHFGYDFTCLMFRGSPDVSCWTEAFQPTIRIFSTLGQPNWLGTYLAALIPIALGFGIYKLKGHRTILFPIIYLLVSSIYFLALLWTRSQSSFLGLGIGLLIFFGILVINPDLIGVKNFNNLKQNIAKNNLAKYIIVSVLILGSITFFIGTPIESLNSKFRAVFSKPTTKSQPLTATPEGLAATTNIHLGGTESSKIRLIVWQGAIELFRRNPLFGTGVETYAYAYYSVKPLAHNLTSEWDYLYNKAHNEYLNYLATTGVLGLGSYLLIIALFLYRAVSSLIKNKNERNFSILLGILGGYAAIIISNFFGFSVVIVNLFFFFLPLFFFELARPQSLSSTFSLPRKASGPPEKPDLVKMTLILILFAIFLYFVVYLVNFWFADRKYALGYNLNKSGEYAAAYAPLSEAVTMLPGEDFYRDELSINLATLALLLNENNQATQAAQFAEEAKSISDEITTRHPHNIIFYKTRTKIAFVLSEIDPAYLDIAIDSIQHAQRLAPTDAKLAYNTGLFYSQKSDRDNTERYFKEAIRLKPNYIDAYYALALFYSEQAKLNPSRRIEYETSARENLEFILKNLDPQNSAVKKLLESL